MTRVFAARAIGVAAYYGDDDRLNAWLNGELIHTGAYEGRRATPDEDMFLMTLRGGWNTLLFAVENRTQGHEMYFRVSDNPLNLARTYIAAGRLEEATQLLEQAETSGLALDPMELGQT